jgi:hypothetical protein
MTSLPLTTQPPIVSFQSGWAFWRRWALYTTLGELVGFLAPALAGVLVARATNTFTTAISPVLVVLILVVAGSLEGAAVGYAQWRALRHTLPTLGWREWTGATAVAAALAWLLGMLPNTIADSLGLSIPAILLIWLVVAPTLLLSIGTAQWLMLRRYVAQAWLWIPVNAVAWLLGVLATFIGASLISETMPLALAVGIGVASGVLMGAIVGMLTGAALVWLFRGRGAESAKRKAENGKTIIHREHRAHRGEMSHWRLVIAPPRIPVAGVGPKHAPDGYHNHISGSCWRLLRPAASQAPPCIQAADWTFFGQD